MPSNVIESGIDQGTCSSRLYAYRCARESVTLKDCMWLCDLFSVVAIIAALPNERLPLNGK